MKKRIVPAVITTIFFLSPAHASSEMTGKEAAISTTLDSIQRHKEFDEEKYGISGTQRFHSKEQLFKAAASYIDEHAAQEPSEDSLKEDYYKKATQRYIKSLPKETPKKEDTFKEWLNLHRLDMLSLSLRLGYLWGNTAYDYAHHTSELEYPMNNWVLGGGFTVNPRNSPFSFGLNFWTDLEKDAGDDMKDKDWGTGALFPKGQLWSYTKSRAEMDAALLDIFGRYDFLRPDEPGKGNRVGLLLGFAFEKFDYVMYDLYYETDLLGGQQGQTLYSGQQVLGYEIKYYLPYIGIAADLERENWMLGTQIKWSFYPYAKDRDDHVLRGLTFYGEYDKDPNVWMISVYGAIKLSEQLKINAGVDAALMRINGHTWESGGDPAWNQDQFTDARRFIGYCGIIYTF